MSLTTDLKDELARVAPQTQSEMAAETAAILRFAGGLHLVSGHILIEAELDTPAAALRLRLFLQTLYNAESTVVVVSGGSLRRGKRFVVRVVHKADELARMTGLVDSLRRPVRGLPATLVAGTLRLKYKQASLEELGKHTDPPLTKDAVAGRIRRLLAMADKVAHDRGIPDTEAALTIEMLEDD